MPQFARVPAFSLIKVIEQSTRCHKQSLLVFQMLPAGLTASCEVARREENKAKNRYGNIIACTVTLGVACVNLVWVYTFKLSDWVFSARNPPRLGVDVLECKHFGLAGSDPCCTHDADVEEPKKMVKSVKKRGGRVSNRMLRSVQRHGIIRGPTL